MTNLSPQKRYDEALATGNFSHDDVQAKAVAYLDKLHHEIIANQNTNQGFLPACSNPNPQLPKAYICGAVLGVARRGLWICFMTACQ